MGEGERGAISKEAKERGGGGGGREGGGATLSPPK